MFNKNGQQEEEKVMYESYRLMMYNQRRENLVMIVLRCDRSGKWKWKHFFSSASGSSLFVPISLYLERPQNNRALSLLSDDDIVFNNNFLCPLVCPSFLYDITSLMSQDAKGRV